MSPQARPEDGYVLGLTRKRRDGKWSAAGKHLKVFALPYEPVTGERRELTLSLIVDAGTPGSGGGLPVELVAAGAEATPGDAAELAAMSWHLFGGMRKDRAKLTQPVAVWTYKSGETVVACSAGGKKQSLRLWFEEAKRGRGRRRLHDRVSADRSAGLDAGVLVKRATVPDAPGERVGEDPGVRWYEPAETFYPFGDVRAWGRRPCERRSPGGYDGDPQPDGQEENLSASGRLPWRVLPPGELTEGSLLGHYEELERRDPATRYEPERIRKAFSLGPEGCYVGEEEFDGYVVFTFPGSRKALLECPVYGNAVYVIDSDWRRLSRLSKRELLANRVDGVTRIVHRGDWFVRTRRVLGLSGA